MPKPEKILSVAIREMVCSSALICDKGNRSGRALKRGTQNPVGEHCASCKKMEWKEIKVFPTKEDSIFFRARLLCTNYSNECVDGKLTGKNLSGGPNTPTKECLFCNHLKVADIK